MSRRHRPTAELFADARTGDRAAIARLLSLVERGGDEAREIGRLASPARWQRLHGRAHRRPGCRQVHAHQRHHRPPAQPDDRGRRAGDRPVVAVHRRGDPRRPGAHAGPRHRPRRVHPLDGHPRPPRRAVAGRARGGAAARRRRSTVDPRRDRRRRPGRGRDRRQGRHHRGGRQPRLGRRACRPTRPA